MKIPKEKILANKKPIEDLCGIYFLINGDEIVYVGQTTKGESRIMQHKLNKEIDFDSYSFFKLPKEDLSIIEFINIKSYSPRYNKSYIPAIGRGLMNVNAIKNKLSKMGFYTDKRVIRKIMATLDNKDIYFGDYIKDKHFNTFVNYYKKIQPGCVQLETYKDSI